MTIHHVTDIFYQTHFSEIAFRDEPSMTYRTRSPEKKVLDTGFRVFGNQRGFIALPALSPLGWVLVGMGVLCALLTIWALLERSGRLDCKADLVTAQAQISVLSDTITRQNAGIQAAADAGAKAQEGVRALLTAAKQVSAASAGFVAHARGVIAKPPGKRPDGKDVDCGDAWREIQERAK